MKPRTIGYWTTTVLFALAISAAGIADLMLTPDMAAAMEHLGYPGYFARILGTWKILGALALLAPAFPRLKEWAYAGFFFSLTGAALSHLAVGDGISGAAPSLVFGGLAMASYLLRPGALALRVMDSRSAGTAAAT